MPCRPKRAGWVCVRMGRITTHVLDTAAGRPAAGLKIILRRVDGDPKLIAEISRKFGRCATVLGLDANRLQQDGREVWHVFVNGGRVDTGIDVMTWVKQAEDLGAGEIVLNVMNADGTTAGYDLEMTAAVSEAVKIPVVASGGAGNPQHIYDVLTTGHADAALAASIFHFGTCTVGDVKGFLSQHGVPVRLA